MSEPGVATKPGDADVLRDAAAEPGTTVQRGFGEAVAQFSVLVVRNFLANRCPLRASALAYTTLLALVPLLAVVMSVSASLLKKEGEKPIEAFIDRMVGSVAPQLNLEVKTGDAAGAARRQEVVRNIRNYIANIHSGALGATGMVGLVFVAIMMLSTIEATFNDIWGVSRGRAWVARVVNYWAAITLGPVILALALGLTSSPHFQATQAFVAQLPMSFQVGFQLLFRFVPFVLLAAAFALFYAFMPNTRVPLAAACVGGVVGGVLWQLNNMFNIIYVSNVVSYSKIYGSFGIVPIFLVGMYLSWMILLFGAQVAYTYQHRLAYLQESQTERVHAQGREFIALRIVTEIARRFLGGGSPPTRAELVTALGISPRLASEVIRPMLNAQLLVEVAGAEPGYTLSRSPTDLSVRDVLMALRTAHGIEPATRADATRDRVRTALDELRRLDADRAAQVSLADLAAGRGPGSTGA